jgi:hypothetical protein
MYSTGSSRLTRRERFVRARAAAGSGFRSSRPLSNVTVDRCRSTAHQAGRSFA